MSCPARRTTRLGSPSPSNLDTVRSELSEFYFRRSCIIRLHIKEKEYNISRVKGELVTRELVGGRDVVRCRLT